MWPIGISTGLFYKTDFFDCIHQIKDAGFNAIEICSTATHLDYKSKNTVEKVAKLIRQLNIQPFSFHAPFGSHIDITSQDSDMRENSVHELSIAIKAAANLHARYFVLHPGPEKSFNPSLPQRLEYIAAASKSLDKLYETCNMNGIDLLLENMLPHLLIGSEKEILWIVDGMKTHDVGICLDTGHAFLSERLDEITHKLSSGLRLIHVNDNLGKRDDHLPPPKGAINWPKFIAILKKIAFDGLLMLEMAPGDKSSVDENLKIASDAKQYLCALCR